MSTPILQVRGLHAQYGPTRVLHGIDFEVQQGGITTILGANGAGKTTTLRAMCSMVRTQGEVLLAGERIDGKATENIVRMGVAHVPDGRGTFMHLTVEENLRMGAYTRRDRERRRQQAGTLSGGEQQMLAVSRALMLRPRLLLLDEPSFGLAPRIVQELFEIFGEIRRSTGASMLLVEQNAALALKLADHAYLLETGRVVISGSAESIRNDEAVRRSYLGY